MYIINGTRNWHELSHTRRCKGVVIKVTFIIVRYTVLRSKRKDTQPQPGLRAQ